MLAVNTMGAVMDRQVKSNAPLATFFRLLPECRLPMRADRAAAGTMPTRAYRYCEAMTSASAFGWYVFPPITFSLMWDGSSDILWTYKARTLGFHSEKSSSPDSPSTLTSSRRRR